MTDIKMSGKKKAGSLKVRANTVLCDVVLENGMSYEVVAGIDGALIEANKRIVENPTLLFNDPRYRGYIAIIQQKKDRVLKRDLGSLIGATKK
jgi:glycine cleavage system H lipoate-binding protein|tara:strand:- start:35 stop:313 length:279 start_codon:yes stop_codon:yes gene_type:complete